PIPRRIAQFWDSEAVPADVSVLMASWRAQHPEWEYELFDNAAARRFLRTHFSPAVRPRTTAREKPRKNPISFVSAILSPVAGTMLTPMTEVWRRSPRWCHLNANWLCIRKTMERSETIFLVRCRTTRS